MALEQKDGRKIMQKADEKRWKRCGSVIDFQKCLWSVLRLALVFPLRVTACKKNKGSS